MTAGFETMKLEEFCKMLNESKTANFLLKKVKVKKAERKKGLALIGAPTQVYGMITVVIGGEKREFTFEAGEFEIFND